TKVASNHIFIFFMRTLIHPARRVRRELFRVGRLSTLVPIVSPSCRRRRFFARRSSSAAGVFGRASLVAFASPAVSSAPPNGAISWSFRGIRLSRPPPRRRLSLHFSRAAEALRLVEQPGLPAPVAERSGLRHRNRRQP